MRRLVLPLAIGGLVLASFALPAAGQAQAPPQVSIFDLQPKCTTTNTRTTVSIADTANRASVAITVFSPTGQQIGQGSAAVSGGGWSTSVGFGTTVAGSYEVRATVSTAVASGFINVPCQNPALEFDPPCSTPTTTQVRVTGRWFQPFSNGYVDMNNDGSEELGRLPVDGRGTFSGLVNVAASTAARPVRGRDLDQNVAFGTWSPCPPSTTTTSSSTTTPPSTTITTAPPDDTVPDVTTSTTRPPDVPTVTVPPPTPGATLTVSPELGPAGFVTGAAGTGFPPGVVVLTWSPGVGSATAVVGPDGTFSARMLVMPNDRLGPRTLVATSGTTSAFDAFLVVPSSVQPSGQDVQQITRIRRFNQR